MTIQKLRHRVVRRIRGGYRDVRRVFYPHLRLRSLFYPSIFLKDTSSSRFEAMICRLRSENYTSAVILGNGPSFSLVDDDAMKRSKEKNYLTIGLNRAIYRYITRVLIWSDVETLYSILGGRSVISQDDPRHPMYVIQAVLPTGRAFRDQVLTWERTQSFRAFPTTKLFMFRTVLTAGLHLCHLLGIKRILLAGVDLDSRSYFFETDQYDPSQPYELRTERALRTHFMNYSTHRIVKETLESLAQREGVDIRYLGNSQFLATVTGLRQTNRFASF